MGIINQLFLLRASGYCGCLSIEKERKKHCIRKSFVAAVRTQKVSDFLKKY